MDLKNCKCWSCGYESDFFEWHWFVVDLHDDNESFISCRLEPEYFNNPRFKLIETDHCFNCNIDQ